MIYLPQCNEWIGLVRLYGLSGRLYVMRLDKTDDDEQMIGKVIRMLLPLAI